MNKLTPLELKKIKKWVEKQPPPPRIIVDGKEYIMIKKHIPLGQRMMDTMKEAEVYPESGYGEIKIILQSHKIVCIKKEESVKFDSDR